MALVTVDLESEKIRKSRKIVHDLDASLEPAGNCAVARRKYRRLPHRLQLVRSAAGPSHYLSSRRCR
jgi:hypothetical protein